jgi:hypothetical protein
VDFSTLHSKDVTDAYMIILFSELPEPIHQNPDRKRWLRNCASTTPASC